MPNAASALWDLVSQLLWTCGRNKSSLCICAEWQVPPSPAERVLVSSYRGLPVKCSAKQRPLAFDDPFPWSIQIDVTVLSALQLSEVRNLESPMVIWHRQKRPQPWSIPGYFQISFHQDGNGRSFIRTIHVSAFYSCQPIPVLGGTRLQELPPPAEGAAPLRAAFNPRGFRGCHTAPLHALNTPRSSAASQRGMSLSAVFFPNLGALFKTFWGDMLPSLYFGLSHSHPNNRWHHLTARAHDPSFLATPQVYWLRHMATSYTWTAPLHVFAVKSIY